MGGYSILGETMMCEDSLYFILCTIFCFYVSLCIFEMNSYNTEYMGGG